MSHFKSGLPALGGSEAQHSSAEEARRSSVPFPTPTELQAAAASGDDMERARRKVREAMEAARGQPFSIPVKQIPKACRPAIIAELKAAGWDCRYNDERDGERGSYWIEPIGKS